jgi:integrase
MGNSTAMLDKHYSKYSPIINAEMHSGRNVQAAVEPVAKTAETGLVEVAFAMLAEGKLDAAELLASIGVGRDGYVVTEEIAMKAMAAKGEDLIRGDTLLRILNG